MRWVLFVLAILAFFVASGIHVQSKTVFHEIEVFVVLLGSAVLFSGAAICHELVRLPKQMRKGASPDD